MGVIYFMKEQSKPNKTNKKTLAVFLICSIFFLGLATIKALDIITTDSKTSESKELTKTATLSEDGKSVLISIDANIDTQAPKILFMQGTLCQVHNLTNETIVNAINSILQYADVDYAYATSFTHSDNPNPQSSNGIKSFKKNTKITVDDIEKTGSTTGGYHVILDIFAEDLQSILSNNEYDMVVLLFDGFAGGGLSEIRESAFHYTDVSQNIYNSAILLQKFQKDNGIIYLLPTKGNNDTNIYWDNFYEEQIPYFSDSQKTPMASKTNMNQYLSHEAAKASLAVEAFLNPTNWLKLVDTTGNYTIKEMPELSYFSVPKNMVDYSNSNTVSAFLNDLQEINKIIITDTLVAGLEPTDITVQEYDETSESYKTITEGYTQQLENQTLTITFDYEGKEIEKRKVRVLINTTIDDYLGKQGEIFKTNEGDACIKYNHEETTIVSSCVESPEIQKEEPEVLSVQNPNTGEFISNSLILLIIIGIALGIWIKKAQETNII